MVSAAVPEFAGLRAAEERHFWFRARNRILESVFRRLVAPLPEGYRVLEVGAGNGNVLRMLERVCESGHVTGSELHAEGVANARQRVDCPIVQADVYDLPFREPFDLIGMFDVLEHLPDAEAALRSLREALTPEGRIVLTVPAHMALWSEVDVAAGHYLRYSPARLRQTLMAAGFRVNFVGQFMAPLFPLMWLSRRLAGLRGKKDVPEAQTGMDWALGEMKVVPVLNGMLVALLGLEAPLLSRRIGLPFGTSLLAVATR